MFGIMAFAESLIGSHGGVGTEERVRLTFEKSSTTLAAQTLLERVGVCRDIAHLMIALGRAYGMLE